MKVNRDFLIIILSSCLPLMLMACSHTPHNTASQTSPKYGERQTKGKRITVGQRIADLAKLQVGAPYRYGGASPTGFDCSGLVFYTHGKFGINTPRTSLAQFNTARPVKLNLLKSGDVVFFKISRANNSHVGIYVGKGQFVHAPKSGKQVSQNYLSDPYWKTRIVSAGRFY